MALRSIQRVVRRRGVLPVMRAGSEATRSQSSGSAALSAEVEHHAVGKPALLVPVHPLHNHHSGPAGAGHPRVRTRPDWTCDHLERYPTYSPRVHGRAPVAAQIRSPSPPGHRPCLYCLCCLVEFSVQQYVGGGELLPHRITHRSRTGFCIYRTCRLHRAASNLRRGFGKT